MLEEGFPRHRDAARSDDRSGISAPSTVVQRLSFTDLDVRAVGWVVTRDACAKVLRALLRTPRRTDPAPLRALGAEWRALQVSRARDRHVSPALTFRLSGSALSRGTTAALERFAERMIALCPDRYNAIALRRRCTQSVLQALVGCAGSVLLKDAAVAPYELLADVALVLLAMGLWSLVCAAQLARTYRVVKQFTDRTSQS